MVNRLPAAVQVDAWRGALAGPVPFAAELGPMLLGKFSSELLSMSFDDCRGLKCKGWRSRSCS
jgi:hypothetical protein